MRHVEPEVLALLALGEDAAAPDDTAHLGTCDECSTELAALHRIVAAGRETTPEDVPTAPPPVVWERITAELGLGEHSSVEEPRPAQVRRLPERSRRPVTWLVAAAAAAGIAVGGVGGAWWASRTTSEQAAVLARADLEPLPGRTVTGVASLERDADGARVVVVEVEGDLGAEGYREVWLIAPDLSGMVSIGLLQGTSGRFVVPDEIDVSRYPVVDVSEEPFDGDATHSGNSVVRGTLGA